MQPGPREISTPFRPIPLTVPEGMRHNEFFNSTENLEDLTCNNGLLRNQEDLLLYRKALGHSNEFDCSIIYNTSKAILNPLGRPVRRTQVADGVKQVWNRMNQIIIAYMLETYPDPDAALILAGEASLDATWPLASPGVPSIRMLHNHFMVFPMEDLRHGAPADAGNPNLTDGGQHSLFQAYMRDVYRNDAGKLIVTISQNSIGNAITELLGVVVNRVPDAQAYARCEPALVARLLEVRRRLVEADLGEGIVTAQWPGE